MPKRLECHRHPDASSRLLVFLLRHCEHAHLVANIEGALVGSRPARALDSVFYLTVFSTALLVLTHAPVFLFSITPRCHFTPKSLNSSCCSDPFILLDKTSLEKASCFKSMPGHKVSLC